MPTSITRTLQLAAVRKDAAALTAVEAGNGRRVYTFKASDGDFVRYSDRLSVKGWRVDACNANGVVLFNHDDGAQAARTGAESALPIGKGRVRAEAKADDEHNKPDAGDEQGAKPNTGDEPPPPNESKPETGEPPPADAPTADDEDDKAKGLDAAEAAKGFVEAFKGYIRGSDKE